MTDKLKSNKMVTDAFLSWLIACFVDSASESVVLLAFNISEFRNVAFVADNLF